MNESPKRLTRRQYRLLRSHAKALRDEIVQTIEDWEKRTRSDLGDNGTDLKTTETLMQRIQQDAFRGLIWRSLSKEERYNTPYYRKILEDLRREHPNLEVVNGMHTFVTWPVFSSQDIEAAISSDVEPFEFGKDTV